MSRFDCDVPAENPPPAATSTQLQGSSLRGGSCCPWFRSDATGLSGIIEYVERPHVKLSGDVEGAYVVEETRSDGRLVISPDTSAQAIMERLGHEPAALAEFEAEYGAVRPPDGEG
jgi:hypothetical protein